MEEHMQKNDSVLQNEKVFNDPIHGHIDLHPLLVKVIDTPQFQRLRHIKQLGGGYYVFPGASHNRFEHSIGVCYLAGEFIERLQQRQPELNITESDILCIKLAALCHDLGHGPFSHVFDGLFIPKLNLPRKWKHEDGSVDMLHHLIKVNNLWPSFEENHLNGDHLKFIEELIKPDEEIPMEKGFLYEIVANKRTGIDVDKWDYFARDCHCLGIPNNFDWKRYVKFARVIESEVDGKRQICCRDKEVTNLYEMFHTRMSLHRKAYQHKTKKIVENMITEALLEANEYVFLFGKDGKRVKISDCIHDMYAYTHLNDSIIHTILQSKDQELARSRDILSRLERRQLYKFIGQSLADRDCKLEDEHLKQEIIDCSDKQTLSADDIIVQVVTFDYGMKDENPVDKMRFYTKDEPNRPLTVHKDQVSWMLPKVFTEKFIRVYCKEPNKESTAKILFDNWCKKGNMETPIKGDIPFIPYFGTLFPPPSKKRKSDIPDEKPSSKKKLFSK